MPPVNAELRLRYHEGRLLPFIGAGVSMGVGWEGPDGQPRRGPSWSELVDEAARQLGFTKPDLLRVRGEDLQILEYYRSKKYNELAALRNWLVQELHPPDEALRDAPVLRALGALSKCRVIYTTNFDDFIERSLTLQGRPCKRVAVEGHVAEFLREGGPGALTEVVKFHGDLENPTEMVVSEADYRERLRLATPMDARLRADVLGRVILFMGYSFRDWNVSYLFHLVNSDFGPTQQPPGGPRAYITVADPSDFEQELFGARAIEVIPIRGGRATEDLAALLTELQ